MGWLKEMISSRTRFDFRSLGRLRSGLMNKTETRYAQHLELLKSAGEILWYRFEGVKLRLADKTFFTADFAVLDKSMVIALHEVKGAKGIFQDDSKAKIKIAADLYPFRFYVVYPEGRDRWKTEEV